jgi:hypothetical protein
MDHLLRSIAEVDATKKGADASALIEPWPAIDVRAIISGLFLRHLLTINGTSSQQPLITRRSSDGVKQSESWEQPG